MCLNIRRHRCCVFFVFLPFILRLQNKQRSTKERKKINKQRNELQRIQREGEKQIPKRIIIPVDIKNNKKNCCFFFFFSRKCKKGECKRLNNNNKTNERKKNNNNKKQLQRKCYVRARYGRSIYICCYIFFIRFIHIFCVILPLFCSFLLKHSNNTHSYSEKRGEHTFLTHKFQRLEHHTNSETGKNTTEQERNKILIFIILNCIQ